MTIVPAGSSTGSQPTKTTSKKRKEGSKIPNTMLDSQQSYRSAMRELIAQRWGAVWAALPAALTGDDIEGVHDVRVASRRLRAAMDVAVDCFPSSWYRPLHRTAKAITSALGGVRDRDVLLESFRMEWESAAKLERPGLDRLIDRVERERIVARGEMEAFLSDLIASDVPREAARRFGPAAGVLAAAGSSAKEKRR